MNPPEVNNRGLAPDRCKISVVAIAEWLARLCAAQPGFDQITDIAPLLLSNWRDARERLAVGIKGQRSVADGEYLGMTRHRKVSIDFNPTETIAFGSDPASGWRSGHARGPDYCARVDARRSDGHARGVNRCHRCAKTDFNSELL